jgi:hypothetical protein
MIACPMTPANTSFCRSAVLTIFPNSPCDDLVKPVVEQCAPGRVSYTVALTSTTAREESLAFLVTYGLIFLVPAVATGLPVPKRDDDMGISIFIGFHELLPHPHRYHPCYSPVLPTIQAYLATTPQYRVYFLVFVESRFTNGNISLARD